MNILAVQSVSLVLLIASFVLISLGTTRGNTLLWVIGLGALVLGGLLPVVTRFTNRPEEEPRDAGMENDDRPS